MGGLMVSITSRLVLWIFITEFAHLDAIRLGQIGNDGNTRPTVQLMPEKLIARFVGPEIQTATSGQTAGGWPQLQQPQISPQLQQPQISPQQQLQTLGAWPQLQQLQTPGAWPQLQQLQTPSAWPQLQQLQTPSAWPQLQLQTPGAQQLQTAGAWLQPQLQQPQNGNWTPLQGSARQQDDDTVYKPSNSQPAEELALSSPERRGELKAAGEALYLLYQKENLSSRMNAAETRMKTAPKKGEKQRLSRLLGRLSTQRSMIVSPMQQQEFTPYSRWHSPKLNGFSAM